MSFAEPAETAISVFFDVHIDGDHDLGAFTACDGLGCEVVMEQREEGGLNSFVHQLPGRIKYTNVKLTRPVNADTMKIARWLASMNGTVTRTQAQITVKTHDNKPVFKWVLEGVVPVRWTGPSLSVESPKVATETLELAHHGFLSPEPDVVVPTTTLAKAQLDLREPVKEGKAFKPGPSIEVLKFDFNPKDYSTGLQAGWNFKAQKKPGEHPEYTGSQLRTLDVEMFLDATGEDGGDVSPSIDTLFSTVRPTKKSTSANTPFPPIVVFSWGSTKPFVGVVKSVSSSLTLFRPTGQPVRATCKVSMQEYTTIAGKQNPTSGAVQSSRAHLVVLGDTLASIANAEYGTPTLWRAIAATNGLEDPFKLRLGRELLLPSPAEAAALA